MTHFQQHAYGGMALSLSIASGDITYSLPNSIKPLEMLKIHCIFGAISVLMKVLITISNGLLNLEDSSTFYQICEYCLDLDDDGLLCHFKI